MTITMVNIPPLMNEVDISLFNLGMSPAPKNSPISTDIPRHSPTMMNKTMFIIGAAAPTAASAFVPTNLPTMIESAAL